MCGIYVRAIVDDRHLPIKSELLRQQCSKLEHRGPDDDGVWISNSGHVGLAHQRLSVIDLSDAAKQPFVASDGASAIVFNGEIYNYQELRTELIQLGCKFRSNSDTEVIINGYLSWGIEFVQKLNGMFAFVLYSPGNSTRSAHLILARDRVGEKPLYYTYTDGIMECASEIKALTNIGGLDLQGVNSYLALGYFPSENSIAANVEKLPSGYIATLEFDTGELQFWEYWKLPSIMDSSFGEPAEIAETAWENLKESVRLRLRSDVPCGIFLSGGVDSSLVVAAATAVSEEPIKTFTVAMPHNRLNESAHAKLVADYFSTEHHVLEANDDMVKLFIEYLPFVDEPLGDASLVPTYLVSAYTAQHVKVVLGGDGGDEVYGGYRRYQRALLRERRLRLIPFWMFSLMGHLADKLPAGIRGRARVAALSHGVQEADSWFTPYFDIGLRREMLGTEVTRALGSSIAYPEFSRLERMLSSDDTVDRLMRYDFRSRLPDDYLFKVDRASMASGLEVRSPYLDYKLIEHAYMAIPSYLKVTIKERRRIQNTIVASKLPRKFNKNRKQGFSIDVDELMRDRRMQELLEAVPKEVIKKKSIDKLLHGLGRGRANGSRLFALAMLGVACHNLGLETWDNRSYSKVD